MRVRSMPVLVADTFCVCPNVLCFFTHTGQRFLNLKAGHSCHSAKTSPRPVNYLFCPLSGKLIRPILLSCLPALHQLRCISPSPLRFLAHSRECLLNTHTGKGNKGPNPLPCLI